ncbi:MAG: hypothetical protein ACYC99_13855 [Candidatus Geothermincolia bacterium]
MEKKLKKPSRGEKGLHLLNQPGADAAKGRADPTLLFGFSMV